MVQEMTPTPGSCASGSRAAPFPSPPGLQAPADVPTPIPAERASSSVPEHVVSKSSTAAAEVTASALESVEENLTRMGVGVNRQAIIEAIREAVLRDVDKKVAEKSDELWLRGKQMLSNIQQKYKEKTNQLTEEVSRCHQKQQLLEAENDWLKQVLSDLVSRYHLLGAAKSAVSPGPSAQMVTPRSSTACNGASESNVTVQDTVAPRAQAAAEAGAGAPLAADSMPEAQKLPDLPEFPFPASPLLLAEATYHDRLLATEALGTPTQQKTPLCLVNSLSPEAVSPAPPTPTPTPAPAQPGVFSFTLRKADGADLGLNVYNYETDKALVVESVRADGAVEAWNRQCAGTASADKAVGPGDKIISVNNISGDPKKMLEECRDKLLLRLTFVRGDATALTPPLPQGVNVSPAARPSTLRAEASPATRPSTLRAEAATFVPMTGAAAASQEQVVTEQTTDMRAGPEAQNTDEWPQRSARP